MFKFVPGAPSSLPAAPAPAPPPPPPVKRKRVEPLPSHGAPSTPATIEGAASPPGKRRGKRGFEITPPVASALQELDELVRSLRVEPSAPGKRPRMPPQLHAPLARLGALAMSVHPQGHLATSVLDAVAKILPFHQLTIRSFMKPERPPDEPTPLRPAGASSESALHKLKQMVYAQLAQRKANPSLSPDTQRVFQWNPDTEKLLYKSLRVGYDSLRKTNEQRKAENQPPVTDDARLTALVDEVTRGAFVHGSFLTWVT